jgi:hypothetical protein
MEYLQPNISIVDTIEIIKNKIRRNEPFCLTRFGDGELRLMKNTHRHDEGWVRRVCNTERYSYPTEVDLLYDDYSKMLWDTFNKSDIVGIMDKYSTALPGPHRLYDWSITMDELEKLGIDYKDKTICDHQISRSKELSQIDNFKEIIQGKDIHIISKNFVKYKKIELDKILGVNITYTDHPNLINNRNKKDFTKNFKNIKEDVVIMGIGLQKDHGPILRDEHKKISIDMGATMDAWVGILSRPSFVEGKVQHHLVIKK